MADDSNESMRGPATGSFRSFYLRHRVGLSDLGLLALLLLLATYYAYEVDIFREQWQAVAVEHTIETDETLMLGGLLMAALLIFSTRRSLEQKRETRRRVVAEHEARTLAYQDPLTGLPNRRQFEEAIAVAVGSPPRAGSTHALFMLDLNGFKQVNDTYGHGRGDELLVIVAQRLLRAVSDEDLVARLGGDEFCVLARHLSGADAAAGLANRMIDSLTEALVIDGTRHDIGAGVGIALIPQDALTVAEALRKADVALYRAKAERRSALRFFEPEMDKAVREKEHIERLLRDAVRDDRVDVRYRPSFDIVSGRVVGLQAVPHIELDVDWDQKRLLAISEETGLAHQIARRVLTSACQAASSWGPGVTLSFDLLAGQIRDRDLAHGILKLLTDFGISPGHVEIGVDESQIVHDLQAVMEAIEPMQLAGIKIALINFGTGYSNLYHIQALKLDRVRIDSRYTDSHGDMGKIKIARALAGLGQGLGMAVTASGSSLPALGEDLRGAGINEFQWAGISMSGAEVSNLVVESGIEPYGDTSF